MCWADFLERYHGTSDFLLAYANLAEQMKMWSNLLDVAFTQNITNTPLPGYTKMVYGDGTRLVGISALDVGYDFSRLRLQSPSMLLCGDGC